MPVTRKRFGQHFLTDEGIIHQIVDAVSPRKNDVIVEIGPGKGALTFPLLSIHPNLIAIEIDRDLIASLKRSTNYYKNFELIQADVLEFDFLSLPAGLKIIGNLPYNISTPLLFYLLNFKAHISEMVFMLQREMVDRICAEPNTPDYGRLSVMLQHDFDAELLFA
jgi:16S rRNA (adenine1518-N6/adenine1519-N6)-dimethyltransferase